MASHISLPDLGAALAGLSALSTAAFGLLDATKWLGGGVSNLGTRTLRRALDPFEAPLAAALGADQWWPVVRASWLNGVAKDTQKAKAMALIKLGLSPQTAPMIAAASHVKADALTEAARKLENGESLTDADLNVVGRMNAAVEALMDAAFERADQQYRNGCRFWAGVVALGLSVGVWALWKWQGQGAPAWWQALLVGVLAVPVAPLAKDLTSGLSAAIGALKAARSL
jgi:hypothetical protein